MAVEPDVRCAGSEPVAITIASAETRRSAPSRSTTTTVCSSAKRAVPSMSVTWLRRSWSRITARSRSTTWRVRSARSSIRISSFSRVVLAVEASLAEAREVEDGLADRLRGDRPGVDRRAAEMPPPLDQGDALPRLSPSRDRCLLTGRPGAEDDELDSRAPRSDPASFPIALEGAS